MRVTMIFVGTELIDRFHWIIYIFGAFLVYTGVQMLRGGDVEIEPEHNPAVRFVTRYVPITRHYERRKFFTVVDGKRVGTLLLLVLIVVEVTDLVFAVDSIRPSLALRLIALSFTRQTFCHPRFAHFLFSAGWRSREVSLS